MRGRACRRSRARLRRERIGPATPGGDRCAAHHPGRRASAHLVRIVDEPLRVIAELLLLVVIVGAGWIALTRAGTRRVIATVVAGVAVVALIVSVVNAEGSLGISMAIRIVALVVAVALAKYALGTTVAALKQSETEGTPVPAADRGVLFMNLKSGGGKAERFHLVDECTRRGIQPVVLEPGQDWLQIVRDVAASGVDVLGMAGGDGSQAMVGTVAAEMGLPMVVVPAGTRNHLALDLGLDRDDVVGALDAYGEAVERTMDLADVNGHVFVNNVSLGLYAAIVRSAAYRDAKVDTTLATLPQVLGPQSEPFDLRFTRRRRRRSIEAPTSSRSPTTPTARRSAAWGAGPGWTPRPLGVVALVLGQAGRRGGVPGRPRDPAIRSASRGSRRGRHRRSRSRPTPRSRWGSTARPRSWTRRCGSRSARPRSGCDSRSTPSATRRPPARSAGEPRRVSCGASCSDARPGSGPDRGAGGVGRWRPSRRLPHRPGSPVGSRGSRCSGRIGARGSAPI